MGNTSSWFKGGRDALEGVFGDGRKNAVCCSPASRRADGGTLQGVWHLPQDRLQDLRSLSGVRHSGADRQKSASLSLRQPASVPGGKLYLECETRAPQLGCSQNPRALASQIFRYSDSCQKYHPCGARSLRPGRASRPCASSCARNSGAPITKASSCWATTSTAIR